MFRRTGYRFAAKNMRQSGFARDAVAPDGRGAAKKAVRGGEPVDRAPG